MNVIENEIICIGEKLNELVYEKFNSGEINIQQLQEVYSNLSEWTKNTEHLLNILYKNGLKVS